MSCVLSFVGEDMDADELVRITGLTDCRITRKGEPRHQKAGKPIMAWSVVSTLASEADDYEQQVTEVIQYLEDHKEKLEKVALVPNVSHATLDFYLSYDTEMPYKTVCIGPELAMLAGSLNLTIALSLYNSDMFESLESATPDR